jgi:hypothetical protein
VAVAHICPKAVPVVLQRLGNHSVCKGRIRYAEVVDYGQGPRQNRLRRAALESHRARVVRDLLDIAVASHEGVVKAGSAHDVALERHFKRHILVRRGRGLSARCQSTDSVDLALDVVDTSVEDERNTVLMSLAGMGSS